MEEQKRVIDDKERDIVFSRTVKAGKRIYYIDVKRNRKDELYLAITESKKVVEGLDPETQRVNFEKHKIFVYKEDFDKFLASIVESINFMEEAQGKAEQRRDFDDSEIKIDMEF